MGRTLGRVVIGAAMAAVAMFIIGYIFFGTPLARLGTVGLGDAQAAAVQQTMAANLPRTGTYFVPSVDTQAQTNMFSQGPIATIHYNTSGFAAMDSSALAGGLVLNFIAALLIGLGLNLVAARVADLASRIRLVVLFALGAGIFAHLSRPIYYHHDWANAIYVFVADTAMLAVAGVILAWFLPVPRAGPADAPTDV